MPNPFHALISRARGTISAPASEPSSPKKEPRRTKDDSQLRADRRDVSRDRERDRERELDRLDEDDRTDEAEGHGGEAEKELRRLQRAYKLLEADRRAYAESAAHAIGKQKAAITNMQSENSELERQVEVLTKMRAKERGGDTETVKREIATYNSKINAMNSSLTSTNQSIASLQGRMAQLRQQTSGSHSLSSESHILAQQLKSSESRLDKATERYNELLTNNRKLRDSITSVRHELAAYSGAWRKLDKEAAEVKKRMADLVLATNEANAARDASQIRLLRLKEVQSREREAYEREMRELQRKKEADAKLRQFLAEKIAERKEKRIELERERRELDKGVSGSIAVLHQIRTLRETVDLYAEVLEELRDMVAAWEGLDKNAAKKLEAKELLQRFAALEHRSFSLFSYVNELAMKAANYRAKLAVMRDEIKAAEQKRAERNQGTEEKRDKLERYLNATKSRVDYLQSQLQNQENILTAFLSASRTFCLRLSSLSPIVPARIRFTPPPSLQVDVKKESAVELLRFAEEKAVELIEIKEKLLGTALAPAASQGSRPGTAGYRSRPTTGGPDANPQMQRRGSVTGRRRSSVFFGIGSTVKRVEGTRTDSDSDEEERTPPHSPRRPGSRAVTPKKGQETVERKPGWVPFETPSVTREEWDVPPSDEEESGEIKVLMGEDLIKAAKASIERRRRAGAASESTPTAAPIPSSSAKQKTPGLAVSFSNGKPPDSPGGKDDGRKEGKSPQAKLASREPNRAGTGLRKS